MFIRPTSFAQLVPNCPWGGLDRALAARADRIAGAVDVLMDEMFNAPTMRDDPITRHALLASFIGQNVWLLHHANEPRDELLVRVRAALLATKLSDPRSLPALRNHQSKD